MATRIEKIFRANTIYSMNRILNDVNECVNLLQEKSRMNKKEVADTLKTIAKTVDDFFLEESVTDEELQRVLNKGRRK
jgi:uncharacterized membrane protein YfbV (UPF0208 family)